MSGFVWFAVLLVVAVGSVVVFNWLRARRGEGRDGSADFDRLDTLAAWPPQATRILTTHERLAYSTLLRAFPDYMVLAQVPLSRFLKVPTRHSHAEWLRRIGNLCADLLVCDMASQVVAVVIVQPAGGLTSERAALRRERLTRVLKSVGIRLLIWVENSLPSPDAARDAILPAPAPSIAPETIPTPDSPSAPNRSAADDGTGEPPPTWYDELDSRPTPLRPLDGPGTSKR